MLRREENDDVLVRSCSEGDTSLVLAIQRVVVWYADDGKDRRRSGSIIIS